MATQKIIGRMLEVIGVLILIINAVLLNMENKNLGTIGGLIVIGNCMFFTGLILCHLPQGNEKIRRAERELKIEKRSDIK